MKKKHVIPIITALTIAAMLAGCGADASNQSSQVSSSLSSKLEALTEAVSQSESSASSETDTEAEPKSTVTGESKTVSGKVTGVTASTLTMETGVIADGAQASDIELSGNEMNFPYADDVSVSFAMPEDGSGFEPPAKPDGDSSSEPPAKPDGDSSSETDAASEAAAENEMQEMPAGNEGGEMPEMPAGNDGGEMPEMPGNTELSVEDLAEGDILSVELNNNGEIAKITILSSENMPSGGPGGAPGGAPGSSSVDIEYTAVNKYTADAESSGETFESTGADENAVLVTDGASVSIDSAAVTRSSEESTGGDNASFYGVGAALLAADGTLKVSDSTIATDADGGAGVFAYGDGTAYVENCIITTEQGASGGIHTAGGGTLYAWNCDVTTEGGSSAAIRSDRGGGTMVVDGGSYTSNGSGSPAIYSTADITVHDADLTASGSEAICIEGLNTIRLYDCDLAGNMSDDSQNDCTWNVILYQSMSGDSEVGNSTFLMDGGTLTAKNGGMFYTTNTESTFILQDVDITYADENDFFLKCTGNANKRGWGSSGSNGADCSFTAIDQDCEGDILWDSISVLDFYLTGESTLTGAVINDESNAGDGGSGTCSLYLDSSSSWIVTADSTLTNLYSEGTITDESGKDVTIRSADGSVLVKGDSSVTITVTGEYSETADMSGVQNISDWSEFEINAD